MSKNEQLLETEKSPRACYNGKILRSGTIFGFGVCFIHLPENACLLFVITRVTVSFLWQDVTHCISTTPYDKHYL